MNWEENLDFYEKVIALFPSIERKGKSMPYTSMNGYMFSFLDKEGKMGLRLSNSERENFITNFDSKLMEQHGRIMKEFVVVPQALLENTDDLAEQIKMSYNYVSNLKPKPTKKSKK